MFSLSKITGAHCSDIKLLLLIILIIPLTRGYRFCGPGRHKQLCEFFSDSIEHIVCDPAQIEMNGTLIGYYPMTEYLKRHILFKHNYYRDIIAGGEQKAISGLFPKASRMRELVWDDELAYVAAVNCGRCAIKHDKCRNVDRFNYVGQNLGYNARDKPRITAKETIDFSMDGFFDEKDLCASGPGMASKYTSGHWGHFTQMMNDQVSRVGCALAYCTKCDTTKMRHCHYFACNYDMSNIVNEAVYEVTDGPDAANNCSAWRSVPSKRYPNLCENNGLNFNLFVSN